jgi:hypothetical protein
MVGGVLGLLLSFLVSCTTLAPGAEKVRAVDSPGQVASCTLLGEVEGSVVDNIWGVVNESKRNELRNSAFARGADTVLITSHTPYTHVRGMAYRCEQPKP